MSDDNVSGTMGTGATMTPNLRPRTEGSVEELPTATADRYVIDRELGQGGQSVVFAAKDGALNREVALKTSRHRGNAAQDFVREARITGQLEHPGIVPVHELGRTAAGELFCTQKLVRGRTLRKALEEATTLEERLKLLPHFIDLCHAVAYAHSRGVVHRDLKPENVMVGEFGETVVLDWGVARVLGSPDTLPDEPAKLENVKPLQTVRRLDGVTSGSTRQGAVVGTPLYMSPEQARGEVDQIDTRSDVWSLGVMLYELIAFVRPFESTDVRSLLLDVGRGHFRPVEEVAPEAPPELAAIVNAAMKVEKAQRPADARALAAELSDFRAGKRVSVYQYSSLELVKRFVARNRALTAVTLLSLVALAVSELYAWSLVGARDAALGSAKSQLRDATFARGQDAARRGDWNRALTEFRSLPTTDLGAALAIRALSSWEAPVRAPAGVLPISGASAGAFDVESGLAVLSSPGRGAFLIDDDKNWRLVQDTTDPERAVMPTAVAPGGKRWLVKSAVAKVMTSMGATALEKTERAQVAAFSDDGARLAVALPGEVRVYVAGDVAQVRELGGAPTSPVAITLNREGVVVVSDEDGLWWSNADERQPTKSAVEALTFVGERLAAGDANGRVRLFDATTRAWVNGWNAHERSITAMVASPDGLTLATGSVDGTVRLWDVATSKRLATFEPGAGEVRALSFTLDGRTLGALDASGRRFEWKLTSVLSHQPMVLTGAGPTWELEAGEGVLWARTSRGLVLVRDGKAVWRLEGGVPGNSVVAMEGGALIGRTGAIDLHDVMDGTVTDSRAPCRATVWAMVADREGTLWLACGPEVLTLDGDKPNATGIHARTPIKWLTLSPDGTRLAWMSEDGSGALVNLETSRTEESWNDTGRGQALAFSEDGKSLLIATEAGLSLRHGRSGVELKRLSLRDVGARAVGFVAGGAWVAGREGLALWTLDGARVIELPGLHGEVTAAITVGKSLVLADANGQLFDYALP